MRLKIAELNITIIIPNMLNHPATSPPPTHKHTVLTSYVDMTRSPTEDLVKFVNNNYDDLWWVFDGIYPPIIQIYCDIRITYVENEVQDWQEVVGLQRLLRHYASEYSHVRRSRSRRGELQALLNVTWDFCKVGLLM